MVRGFQNYRNVDFFVLGGLVCGHLSQELQDIRVYACTHAHTHTGAGTMVPSSLPS